MAFWEKYTLEDLVKEIDEGKFVLPVIQRSLVWEEDKMELLFDTLLKGDSFGGIMVIEEEEGTKPLFSYRPFTKDGNFIPSQNVNKLKQRQFFVIDGQQRLQTFYIGLKGSINGKVLYFDLFSEYNFEYEFKFEKDENKLPKVSRENNYRKIPEHLWYPVNILFEKLKNTRKYKQVVKEIIDKYSITDEIKKDYIEENIHSFYENVLKSETIGISKVEINKSLPELENRQRIVELFRRLNDGGTRLSAFELVASILKGYFWEMEGFLREMLEQYQDIGLTQDNLIKLIFLLQDNPEKEMTSIEASDAEFAIQNSDRIKATIKALKDFLEFSNTYNYYKEGNRSFIPLFFISYHLFHKDIGNNALENYFNNYETRNSDFPLMKRWLYHSLINGVFRSKGVGWTPSKTGVRKLLEVIKNYKNQDFPAEALFKVYIEHPLRFTTEYSSDNLDQLDSSFVFYLMYDGTRANRTNDIDHVMPKNILAEKGFNSNLINSIKNYQLLDYGTNRGAKNGKPFKEWINNPEYVKDKSNYIKIHLIPSDETLWEEDKFNEFIEERAKLIIGKIEQYVK